MPWISSMLMDKQVLVVHINNNNNSIRFVGKSGSVGVSGAGETEITISGLRFNHLRFQEKGRRCPQEEKEAGAQ